MVNGNPSIHALAEGAPGNVLRLLESQGRDRPGQLALQDGERQWTFATLNAEAARFAGALREAGLQAGDRVGVCLRDTADHLIARLAAGRAGLAVVPMDWRVPLPERTAVAQRFRLAAVLTEPGALIEGARCIPVDTHWATRVSHATELPFVDDPDLPLVLNLSSGTTGLPKAAVVTHANYAVRIQNNIDAIGSLTGIRYLSSSPLYFSAGSHFCLTTLLQGGAVILYPPLFGTEEYVEAVRENAATMAFLVPTALRWLIALPPANAPLLPSLKLLIATASPLTAEERQQIAQRVTPNFYDLYGSAGGGNITVLRPAEIVTHADTVGRAVGDVQLQVVDDADDELPPGTVGRVRLRGAGVVTAWFDPSDSEEGAAITEGLADGWLYTGDVGTLDADGFLTLQGRVDDMIIRGGANVYPEVVEAALRRCPGVGDAAVVGRPLAGGDPVIVALVVAVESDTTLTVQALHAHCRSVLPAWMQPAEILLVDDLPRTTSGKVKRRELLR
ncbi:MAG: class I adenylate-forming enzyme family protein [Gammaproteobacteria bacterium]